MWFRSRGPAAIASATVALSATFLTAARTAAQPPVRPLPRLVAPPSGSIVNKRVTFVWAPVPGGSGVEVDICADRTCSRVVTRISSSGPRSTASADLLAGNYYWLVRMADHRSSRATWQLRVRERDPAGATSAHAPDLDLNGDGFADLAVPLSTPPGQLSRVAVFPGSTNGLVGSPRVLPAPPDAYGFGTAIVSLADVNGDGFGDLAITAPSGGHRSLDCTGQKVMGERPDKDRVVPDNTGRIYVFLGSATGVPPQSAVTLMGAEPGARLGDWISGGGDVDGDGYADLLAGAAGGLAPDFSCALRNGPPPSPASRQTVMYLGGPRPFASAQTGLLDSGCSGFEKVASNRPAALVLRAAIVGDLDGDGNADVYTSCDTGSAATSALRFGPLAGAASVRAMKLAGAPGPLALPYALGSDVDGDGTSDLLVVPAYTYDRIAWYRNLAGDSLVLDASRRTPSPRAVGRQAVVHDFDGDGRSDLVVAVGGFTKRAYVHMGSARGLSQKSNVITAPSEALRFATWASAGDFNGDGFGDLVLAGFVPKLGDRFYVYSGGPAGLPSTPTSVLSGPH